MWSDFFNIFYCFQTLFISALARVTTEAKTPLHWMVHARVNVRVMDMRNQPSDLLGASAKTSKAYILCVSSKVVLVLSACL